MANYIAGPPIIDPKANIFQQYSRVWLLAASGVLLSAAIIVYYNHKMYYELIRDVYNSLELTAITLMPYMISAVVATITAIGVMSMLPMLKATQAAQRIYLRVKQMSDGDLTTTSRIDCRNQHLNEIAAELNYAIGFLGSSVAQWKIINRQQWNLLECVRQATLDNDHRRALKLIEKIEENWKLTAKIEDKFRT
jgi:hypothetical protein